MAAEQMNTDDRRINRLLRRSNGRRVLQFPVPFSALIFDFDGLIIDSETPIFRIWEEIYREHGASLSMEGWQHALGTHHGFDPFADLARRVGVRLDREVWGPRISEEHWRRCEDEPLLPGVAERLEEAAALGIPAAVASSSNSAWVRTWIERHGLAARFAAICTRDDVTAVKPAPDLFLLAARRLGVAPRECLVFEDSPNGLRAARAAGMWAIAVPNALTRALDMPPHDLRLESLADVTLADLADRLRAESRT
jgi:HAD superfamily hydrolase (TIGR01509 family)